MSLSTTHRRVAGRQGSTVAVRTVILAALVIAVAIVLARTPAGSSALPPTPARLGHAEFLELNTVEMPAASAADVAGPREMSVQGLLERNVPGYAGDAAPADRSVSEHFAYWNVEAFEGLNSTRTSPEETTEPISGPR